MKHVVLAAVAALCVAVPVAAQVVPSAYVPLNPCHLYSTLSGERLAAETPLDLVVRGFCGVPANANAVALTVVALNPDSWGFAKVLESGALASSAQAVLSWKAGSGSTSGNPIVRLCYPLGECPTDIQVWSSVATDFVVRVSGYFVPLEE